MTARYLLKAADIEALPEQQRQHQFNDNAVRLTRTLGTAVGLQRVGLHLVRLQTGRDSTEFHYHDADEEFLYILSGRGIATLGDETFEVQTGDFMGFPAPSPAHSMHNPHEEDLVYLMGGERNVVDIVHYPRISRSMIKSHGRRLSVDWADLEDVGR